MESKQDLEKFIEGVNSVLVNDRLKLDQKVFIERHLPTIIKNGNLPTKELQAELIKIAGSDIKIIDLIDENGKTVISLPPAIGSSKTISNSTNGKLSKLNRTFSDIAESIRMGNEEGAQLKLKKVLKENKQDIIECLAENPWENIVKHFQGSLDIKSNKSIKKTEAISFDYN